MPEYIISGIPINFPFEPYDVQKVYMEKVIACLKDGTNGVLESPTGTGKTLSLLCSSLAWVLSRKSLVEASIRMQGSSFGIAGGKKIENISKGMLDQMEAADEFCGKPVNWGVPKIIYASRTHSQLTQAMQELKRTAYSCMRAVVLGSRDQLCIHPEVMREQGHSNKIQMCKLRVQTKSCSFFYRVESKKDHPDFRGISVMDIEDLVKVGQKLKICPYYAAKELVNDADITFMPYNYILDTKTPKANKIELKNAIVILDEAHNIEKICEESASVHIRSSDIAMAIDDITHIMKHFSNENNPEFTDEPKDFSLEDLALLKEMLLDLEKAIDAIVIENTSEGTTFPASYIFDLLGKGNFNYRNCNSVLSLLDKLIQFLAVQSLNNAFRKGGSFQVLADLLTVVFVNKEEIIERVYKSFKVHVQIEEVKTAHNSRSGYQKNGWLSKASKATSNSKTGKIINYWCFNPGFGMEQLLNRNVRSLILTSGTLAPLKPLIAELAIPVAHCLENPHIVSKSQVYVKIIGSGPDREQLISNYNNRDNPKYISSLGQTILNIARIVPDGLLVFFPSYPVLNQCVNSWQASGVWGDISRHKPIFVEPRNKDSFSTTMEEFYKSIQDSKGACFMAVCRGKVSEGLDFADRNGRAVIITGLPFPPFMDPKVILKRRYLDDNRTKENELLSGQEWYGLDATRAVNQAVGRVIRHRNDYGAILLCDTRFQQSSQVDQLSKWIRGYLGPNPKSSPFGPIVRELREFFRNAEKTMPKPKERSVESLVHGTCNEVDTVKSKVVDYSAKTVEPKLNLNPIKVENANNIESWTPADYAAATGKFNTRKPPTAVDFMSRLEGNVSTIDFNNTGVTIHKRERTSPTSKMNVASCSNADPNRKKRFKLITNQTADSLPSCSQSSLSLGDALTQFCSPKKLKLPSTETKKAPEERVEFLRVLRASLTPQNFSAFTAALISYKRSNTFEELMSLLLDILGKPSLHYMLLGMRRFLKPEHKSIFDERVANIL